MVPTTNEASVRLSNALHVNLVSAHFQVKTRHGSILNKVGDGALHHMNSIRATVSFQTGSGVDSVAEEVVQGALEADNARGNGADVEANAEGKVGKVAVVNLLIACRGWSVVELLWLGVERAADVWDACIPGSSWGGCWGRCAYCMCFQNRLI